MDGEIFRGENSTKKQHSTMVTTGIFQTTFDFLLFREVLFDSWVWSMQRVVEVEIEELVYIKTVTICLLGAGVPASTCLNVFSSPLFDLEK